MYCLYPVKLCLLIYLYISLDTFLWYNATHQRCIHPVQIVNRPNVCVVYMYIATLLFILFILHLEFVSYQHFFIFITQSLFIKLLPQSNFNTALFLSCPTLS